MGIETRTLTQNEQMIAQQQAEAIANAGSSAISEKQFTFFAAFDGTNNQRDKLAGDTTTLRPDGNTGSTVAATDGQSTYVSSLSSGETIDVTASGVRNTAGNAGNAANDKRTWREAA
jgi:hypothetical protein